MQDEITAKELVEFFWLEGDLSYKLDDLQTLINDTVLDSFSHNKKTCVLSSRQIGKSFWVMVFAVGYLLRNPKTICRVIAPTKDKCEEIVEDNLNVILQDAPPGFVARSTSKNRWNFYNRSSLRIGALERQFVDKNRGGNASVIIYEECGFVSGDDFNYGVNSVIAPQLLRSRGNEIFVSSPSEDPEHPLHTVIAPSCQDMGTLFQYNVFQSHTISDEAIVEAGTRSQSRLPMDFVMEVRKKEKSLGEDFSCDHIHEIAGKHEGVVLSDDFRREYMAEIIRPTTLMVIPKFYPKTCIVKADIPAVCIKSVAIDWGGVRDKTACYVMLYNFTRDEDWFIDELVFDENTTTDIIVSSLKIWEELYEIKARWADIPGQLQVDLNNNYGYTVQLPPKTDWKSSVNSLAARFALDKVRIFPKCKFLIKSVKQGMFNKTRTDFARSSQLGHMDALAAAMYGIRTLDRSNPYAGFSHSYDDKMFTPPSSKENDTIGEVMRGGKGFGKFKK